MAEANVTRSGAGFALLMAAAVAAFCGLCGATGHAQNAAPRVRIFQENTNCAADKIPCRTGKQLALVFVHGLTGAKSTWEHQSTSKYWPDMIVRDRALQDYDVFRVDFDSFRFASSPSISQINSEFAAHIDRLADSGYRHVAFIAHSLGGLIVQRYLTDVISFGGHTALNKFRIVIFLGTPQKGSSLAKYVDFLTSNPQLRILRSYQENDFAQLLQEGMQGITSKHDAQMCATLRFFAAYEGKKTGPVTIVERDSAVALSHACQEFPLNHIDISKPTDETSDLYTGVRSLLVACASENRKVCPPPSINIGCVKPNERGVRNNPARCEFNNWSNVTR